MANDYPGRDEMSKCHWHFLNAVLLVRIVWFLYQAIYRGADRSSLTQIEVAALAYVALAGLVYSMWWNKPNLSWRKPVASSEHEPLINTDGSSLISRQIDQRRTSQALADPQSALPSQDSPSDSSSAFSIGLSGSGFEDRCRVARLLDALILDPFHEIHHGFGAMLGLIPRVPEF